MVTTVYLNSDQPYAATCWVQCTVPNIPPQLVGMALAPSDMTLALL